MLGIVVEEYRRGDTTSHARLSHSFALTIQDDRSAQAPSAANNSNNNIADGGVSCELIQTVCQWRSCAIDNVLFSFSAAAVSQKVPYMRIQIETSRISSYPMIMYTWNKS